MENCDDHGGANASAPKDGVELNNSSRAVKRNRKQVYDPPYRARLRVKPEETRRSLRIANSVSSVGYKNIVVRDDKESDSGDNIVYYNKKSRKSSGSPAYFSEQEPREKGNVDTTQPDCDQEEKEQNGSVCHQCQEFTNQVKSVCRNTVCVSVNPQLCGSCLDNHYGEDLESALKNPEWKCPFCRGVCSCSLCKRSGTRIVTRCLEYKKKLFTLSNGKDSKEIPKVDEDYTPDADENEIPTADEDDVPSGDENDSPKVIANEIWDDDENKENIDPETLTDEYDPARVFEPDLVIEEDSSDWTDLPTDEEHENAETGARPEEYATSDRTNREDDSVIANKESHNSSS